MYVHMKKYKSYKGAVGKITPNISDRNFTADTLNQKWVMDITEFTLLDEKVYLSPVLDLFNKKLLPIPLNVFACFRDTENAYLKNITH